MANATKKSILQFPHLVMGAIAIFLHVGTQVIAIDTIIGYAEFHEDKFIGSKSVSVLYFVCNDLRLHTWNYMYTKIH